MPFQNKHHYTTSFHRSTFTKSWCKTFRIESLPNIWLNEETFNFSWKNSLLMLTSNYRTIKCLQLLLNLMMTVMTENVHIHLHTHPYFLNLSYPRSLIHRYDNIAWGEYTKENLSMARLDYKKAYDRMLHSWILW